MDEVISMKSREEVARNYVNKMPPAVSGRGGHNATYAAACKCVEFGLEESEAWEVMREFNARCSPQWTEKELGHKIADAYRRAKPMSNTYQKRQSGFTPPDKPTVFAPRVLSKRPPPEPVVYADLPVLEVWEYEDGYVFDLDYVSGGEAEAVVFSEFDYADLPA